MFHSVGSLYQGISEKILSKCRHFNVLECRCKILKFSSELEGKKRRNYAINIIASNDEYYNLHESKFRCHVD